MKWKTSFAVLAAIVVLCSQSSAQQPEVDSYTTEHLIARARQAGEVPLSSEVLKKYSNHYTMLVSRHADGQSEFHEHYADVLIILDGGGQLVTGGTMQGDKETAPGERRGQGILGGSTTTLKTGDIVHIPAGVPHQVRVTPNGSIVYFVVKSDEKGM